MAKRKVVKKVKEESVNNIVVGEIKEPEIIETIAGSTENLKTLPITKEDSVIISEFQEVIGINSAEQLQKSGWQLIDCHQTLQGMVYKFKKGK